LRQPAANSQLFAQIIEHNSRVIHQYTGQNLHLYTLGDSFRQHVWGGHVPDYVDLHEEDISVLDEFVLKPGPCTTPICLRLNLKSRLSLLFFTRHAKLVHIDADAIIVRPEFLLLRHYDKICTFAAMPRDALDSVPFRDVNWNRPIEFNTGVYFLDTRRMNFDAFLQFARAHLEVRFQWDDQALLSAYVLEHVRHWSVFPYFYNCRWHVPILVRVNIGMHEQDLLRERCYAIHLRASHNENLLHHNFDERTFLSMFSLWL
jgi:hypothetical protein